MSFLVVKHLKKSYGVTPVIHDMSFGLVEGSFVSLLGPSGSGKTTILRCLAGLESPNADSGSIRIGDTMLWSGGVSVPPEKRDFGMVFQNYAVWPHLSVRDNVAFPLTIRKTPRQELDERVDQTLALVKLTGLEHRFAHELSGGQQQRVALARALVGKPRLLLLDEPLSNLDALLREELGAEIRRLQRALGLTTILVTHDQKEALSLSDRILVLDRGTVVADGSPEELYNNPADDFVAAFLAGGQRLSLQAGDSKVFLPRRWHINTGAGELAVKIATRIFLGSEYEYLGEVDGVPELIRFFSRDRFEMGDRMFLSYERGRQAI